MAQARKSDTTIRIDLEAGPADTDAGGAASAARVPVTRLPPDPKFDQLLESIYDGVLITNAEGHVIGCNARAASLIRGHADEIIGQRVVDLIVRADEDLLRAILRNIDERRYTVIEGRVVRKDGSSFPAEIAVNQISLDAEARLCFFVRDISVRKQAQEALEDAVRRLEAHDRAQWQFISNVSHELRTPLTSMIYAVTNILSGVVGPVSDRVRRYLEMLDGDCKRLLATVNDILDLRKIDSQDLSLMRARVPLSRLVRRSVESLSVRAQQKAVTMRVDVARPSPFVDCDPQKMDRVVLNIAGNAVKFTPEGGAIVIRVARDLMHDGYVSISVEDDGEGIPAEAIDRVTERYYTVGDQPEGSGLGLALAKEIMALHGGSIEIVSPPPGKPRGTVVTVRLPAVASPAMLVCEDDPALQDLLRSQLTAEGYQVKTTENGQAALDAIRHDRPDAVVLDLVVPVMDGTEVILKAKSDKRTRGVPIIAVTGVAVGPAKRELLRSFSVPVLTKPWDEADLMEQVEKAFLETPYVNDRPE